MIIAFRIHYQDGSELDGNYYKDWITAPADSVVGVEFFHDEWDSQGMSRREYLTNQEEYVYPGNEIKKQGVKTPRTLVTRLQKAVKKPDSINPTKEGDLHVPPANAMKGT